MSEYDQPVKNKSRDMLINHAVSCLTDRRRGSILADYDKIHHMFDLAQRRIGQRNACKAKALLQTWDNWWKYFSKELDAKNACELKVLILPGPQPMNDISALLDKGVLARNIWGVESKKDIYNKAVENLRQKEISVKIFNGSLENFFEICPQVFDIVYFDACGAFMARRSKTAEVIYKLFEGNRLSQHSVLITNFSEPDLSPSNKEDFAGKIFNWLNNKPNIMSYRVEHDLLEDEEFMNKIKSDSSFFYDLFIRETISEVASMLVPWKRFASYQGQKVFKCNSVDVSVVNNILSGRRQKHHHCLTIKNLSQSDLSDFYIKKHQNKQSFKEDVALISLLREFDSLKENLASDILNDDFLRFLKNFEWFDTNKDSDLYNVFFDMPKKNLIIDLLFSTFSYPYLVNFEKHLSIRYKANKKEMYSDCFVFDQARYFFDRIPTYDIWNHQHWRLNLFEQVMLRVFLDIVRKNTLLNSSNLFSFCSIDNQKSTFNKWVKKPEREVINVDEEASS